MGAILTQHDHPMSYHSETISDVICKYPTREKKRYYIVQSFRQLKHLILEKDTIIHTDHKLLQFM
jgi:hypothetical protein